MKDRKRHEDDTCAKNQLSEAVTRASPSSGVDIQPRLLTDAIPAAVARAPKQQHQYHQYDAYPAAASALENFFSNSLEHSQCKRRRRSQSQTLARETYLPTLTSLFSPYTLLLPIVHITSLFTYLRYCLSNSCTGVYKY